MLKWPNFSSCHPCARGTVPRTGDPPGLGFAAHVQEGSGLPNGFCNKPIRKPEQKKEIRCFSFNFAPVVMPLRVSFWGKKGVFGVRSY